jgi:hypothetical protein
MALLISYSNLEAIPPRLVPTQMTSYFSKSFGVGLRLLPKPAKPNSHCYVSVRVRFLKTFCIIFLCLATPCKYSPFVVIFNLCRCFFIIEYYFDCYNLFLNRFIVFHSLSLSLSLTHTREE